MKRLFKISALVVLGLAGLNAASAQTSRQEKKAAEQAAVKKMVTDDHFYFLAQYAQPMAGGNKTLTDLYDLKVTKDSIIAYLPYFGVAYISPDPTDREGGIKFTSTNFNFSQKEGKKGGWEITIKPKDHNITDWRDVQQMVMYISPDGYASLNVISSNRDPIYFQGNIVAKE